MPSKTPRWSNASMWSSPSYPSSEATLFVRARGRLLERRHEVGAAVLGDDDRAARVPEPRSALPVPAVHVAVQEAGRERVSGAQDVLHVDGEAGDLEGRSVGGPDAGAVLAALLHDGRGAEIEEQLGRRLDVAADVRVRDLAGLKAD